LGYIYKITNLVNNKIYIGQTCRTIEQRWKEHLKRRLYENGNGYNYHLYKSMRKYGTENFIIEEIEYCNDDILNEREMFWIQEYESFNPDIGYNATMGGSGSRIYNYNEVYERYDNGESLVEISLNMNISRSYLEQIIKLHENYSHEEVWNRAKLYSSKTRGTPVCQYDLDGNFINTFNSAKEAERLVPKTSKSNIRKSCINKSGLSGGFQWRFLNDDPPGIYSGRGVYDPKPVYQYNLDGELIRSFDSINKASKITNVDYRSIIACCNKKYKTAGGYIWSYENNKEVLAC
jgi:group I intron endonuclease